MVTTVRMKLGNSLSFKEQILSMKIVVIYSRLNRTRKIILAFLVFEHIDYPLGLLIFH